MALEPGKSRSRLPGSLNPHRPQIRFVDWRGIPYGHPAPVRVGQTGFQLENDGIVAHEVRIENFEIEPGAWATSETIAGIREKGEAFALVWRMGFPGTRDTEKWDLLGSVAAAAAKRRATQIPQTSYSLKVSVVYRDGVNVWYRSEADLIYIPTQGRLTFGPTAQEMCEARPAPEALLKLDECPPDEDGSPQPAAAANPVTDPIATERNELLRHYKVRGLEQSITVTDEMVAQAANPNWHERSMITWWKRNDFRCKPPHDRKIRAVLKNDPSFLWEPKP